MSSTPSTPQQIPPLFQTAPCLQLDQVVYDLIETGDPPAAEAQAYIQHLVSEVTSNKCKQHNFKIPHPAVTVPSWLQQTRRQLQNVMVDNFFKIVKKRRAVNRIEEHRDSLTFPPEYSSLKMPQLTQDSSELGASLNSFANSVVLEAKKSILTKQIEVEYQFLNGYRYSMSKNIVAEAYKTLAQVAYRNTFYAEFSDWSSLQHILADHSIIHKLCSQEVHKKLSAETEKRQKLQAAQALAAQQESTMSIKELVNKTVALQIGKAKNSNSNKQNSTKNSNLPPSSSSNVKGPQGKKKKKKGNPPNNAPTKQTSTKQLSGPPKKQNQGKGLPPMGSSSTSSRPQKGGKH